MLPPIAALRSVLAQQLRHKGEQGHVVDGLDGELAALPDSYDALAAFGRRLTTLPLRADWEFVEPDDLDGILAQCERMLRPPSRHDSGPTPARAANHAEAAFIGSVCGCMLGKALEIDPTLDEIRAALTPLGDWPLRDYVDARAASGFPRPLHHSWPETTRGRIAHVAPDDDINYTVLGMLALEQHGLAFTRDHLRELWLQQLPIGQTFGPERSVLVRAGLATWVRGQGWEASWAREFNPREEFCGALIRADAYGYACAGRPELAATLAWKDASLTHLRTGIYGAMYVAAAIACAPVLSDPLAVMETAARFVPRRSRFFRLLSDALTEVAAASDWEDGYRRVHGKYRQWTHCRVFQEVGTLINTMRFAESVGHGICLQVMQGNDTDSFGATAGSLLGAFFGPGHLEARWTAPFHDDLRTSLAQFHERSLAAVARRMAALPGRVAEELARGVSPLGGTTTTDAGADAGAGIAEKSPCRG